MKLKCAGGEENNEVFFKGYFLIEHYFLIRLFFSLISSFTILLLYFLEIEGWIEGEV